MGKNSDLHFVGVDLGGTNIQAGVVDGKNRLVCRNKTKTRAEEGSGKVVRRIAQCVEETMAQAKLSVDDIGGLGIGAPGAVDTDRGVVVTAVNLRWNDFAVAKALASELKLPVTLENDVNVAAWGEYVAGTDRKYPDMMAVWIGTGIGGGFILDGKLYQGRHQSAGEIGHTVLLADAALGRRTLENVASRTAISNLLTQLILANHPSKITALLEGDYSALRSKVIAEALERGDELTIEVVRHAARYVGAAVANCVTLLSLPCVVIGGGFSTAMGKPWIEWIDESFRASVFPPGIDCRIMASKLGDDAGIIGAAALARERLTD